jgi:hypothetical protein
MEQYVYRINQNTAMEFLNTQKFQDAEKYYEARKITHFDLGVPLLGEEVEHITLTTVRRCSKKLKSENFLNQEKNSFGGTVYFSFLDKINNQHISGVSPNICMFKGIAAFLGKNPQDIDYIRQNSSILGKQYILIFNLKKKLIKE